MEMEPAWLFDAIRSTLVVRMDLIGSRTTGYYEMHAVIIGSFEDDDGSDPFVLDVKTTQVDKLESCSFVWKWIIQPHEAYIEFVRAPLDSWPEEWLLAKKNFVRFGERSHWSDPDIRWQDLRMSDPLTLIALSRIQGILDMYKVSEADEKAYGNSYDALHTLRSRLAGLVISEHRQLVNHFDQLRRR